MSIEPSNDGGGVSGLDILFLLHQSLSDFFTLYRAGVQTCHISRYAEINIAIASGRFAPMSTDDDSYPFAITVVILLLLFLFICVIIRRRARAASEQEYNLEANQVNGPPTIIATEYNPTSGPSGIYESPKTGFSAGQSTAQMTGPTYPVAVQHRTAPVTQTSFAYPFAGYSSVSPLSLFADTLLTPSYQHLGPPPQTSFVTDGFPRAVLAGDRLKDRLKERPSSPAHALG